MLIIEWLFDKMGYQKKVDWTALFGQYEVTMDVPDRKSRVTTKKPVKKKPATKKTVKSRAKKD